MTPQYGNQKLAGLTHHGQPVPIVAFYSVQGGVGKSTLARKFAELLTVAPGLGADKPNVLLIDLDVEAKGLTFRLTEGLYQSFRTVHEVIAQRSVSLLQAVDVTGRASLAGGNPSQRGQLYLVPAAPEEAKDLFNTIATIDKGDLLAILEDLIIAVANQCNISCVVIDCAPGASPYTAAAATLADVPFLIGRNEQTTYDQIRVLPERFREMYPQFQAAKQRVIINAVSVKDIFQIRRQQYSIFGYIPMTTDVIHEVEGLQRTQSLRMLLFEKYIVDIIREVFAGRNDLIPEAPEVLGREWMDALIKLARAESAPRIRRLSALSKLRWVGAALVLIGMGFLGASQIIHDSPAWLTNSGIGIAIGGVILAVVGWRSDSEYHRILKEARALVDGGADEVFRKLKEAPSVRAELEEMRKFSETIPDSPKRRAR